MLSKKLSAEKCKDAGLALVLICLLCFQAWHLQLFIPLAIILLLCAMTWPPIFRPFAFCWFGLSNALGAVVSKVILALLFLVLVLPVGLVRRGCGKDAMQVKGWKKGVQSVFRKRNHRFTAKDLEHPY